MKLLSSILLLICIFSCSSHKKLSSSSSTDTRTEKTILLNNNTYLLVKESIDSSYGFTNTNPVKVGGIKTNDAVLNEQRFLNALLGPNGELTRYWRVGSCCAFSTPNGMIDNLGLLDLYKVVYVGGKDTASIYINMYDEGNLYIPKGFTAKKK